MKLAALFYFVGSVLMWAQATARDDLITAIACSLFMSGSLMNLMRVDDEDRSR